MRKRKERRFKQIVIQEIINGKSPDTHITYEKQVESNDVKRHRRTF